MWHRVVDCGIGQELQKRETVELKNGVKESTAQRVYE